MVLTGKSAVVTGSTSGIGLAIARALAAAGAHVMINGFGEEAEIAAALADAEVEARREVVLSDGSSRIDLLAGRVGIEVKVAGARDAVDRQLTRYAKCEEISALVLVTTRAGHGVGRYELEGVPVFVCSLIGAGL